LEKAALVYEQAPHEPGLEGLQPQEAATGGLP